MSTATPPFGFYKLESKAFGLTWFIKIVPINLLEQQDRANNIAQVVQQQGIKTNCLLDDFPKILDNKYGLLAYPWIAGRYLRPNKREMQLLGHNLAHLHLALRDLPMKSAIKEAADERFDHIEEIVRKILSGDYNFGPFPERIRLWIEEKWRKPSYSKSSQVIHGDLNIGNILFSEEGSITFLDFEDTIHSWLPPKFDLAMALERFTLINTPDNQQAQNLSWDVLETYIKISPNKPFEKTGDLYQTLLWLALRSCCLLNIMEDQGQGSFIEEWKKQLNLLDHLESRKSLLATIEAPYIEQ